MSRRPPSGMRGLAGTLLLALALVGCGPDPEVARFAERYREISAGHERAVSALGARVATDPETDRDALLEVYAEFGAAAARTRDAYAALDQQEATVAEIVTAAEEDDAQALEAHIDALADHVTDWARVNRVITDRLPD